VVAIAAAQPFGVGMAGVAVPWPLDAFAAAPLGLLVAGILTGGWLYRIYCRDRTRHQPQVAATYGALPPTPGLRHRLAAWRNPAARYPYAEDRQRVAAAWAVGDLADRTGVVLATLTAGGVVAVALAALPAPALRGVLTGVLPPDIPVGDDLAREVVEAIASASVLVALVIAAALVALLRSAYTDGSRRRTIGAVWDVGTFWPRAAHPLAPPCYAERAVPEVADRVAALVGHDRTDPEMVLAGGVAAPVPPCLTIAPGPVLLTGYSQGSILAPAGPSSCESSRG
jgi:multisubunit Na+/H+ antiporter MnhC subunit